MKSPWAIKLEEEMKNYAQIIERGLRTELKAIKPGKLDAILKEAIAHKQYDIYHSTTIEGYAITPQEVAAALLGGGVEGKESAEKMRNKMAIVGHAQAFEYIIGEIKNDYGAAKLSEELIGEIYFRLFKPSVDAQIIDRFDILGYRKIKVYIRNSRYVPPSFEKVPELIESFIALVNGLENSVIKAILAHYFFVTIHPYPDGNGRCARLLMNYLLASAGYHWVTITIDKRAFYFTALQKGQLEANILPFAEFIVSFMI